MSDFSDSHDTTHIIKDLIVHIQQCNHAIEAASLSKQSCEQKLKDMLCHTKHGAHTHEFLDYKITITTGSNYSLDKNKFADYLMGDHKIDARYNIVKPVTKYEINAKALKDLEMYGSEKDIELKNSFIKASEKKLHVKIMRDIPEITDDVYSFNVDSVLTSDIDL